MRIATFVVYPIQLQKYNMSRTHISQVGTKIGSEVELFGFVQAIRDQGKIKFLILRDITGTIQCVVLGSSPAFETINDLTLESVVRINGLAKEEKQAPGGYEIEVKEISILSKSDPILPIPVVVEKGGSETELPTRLDYRWIDLRKQEKSQIFKIWTAMEEGWRKYFTENEYMQFYSPSFMGAPSESGSEVFSVDYFGTKAYLAQSPQFYKQMAMASGFEKVFAVGPVFRAEPSYTTRHQTEFTGWDFEISYIKDHHEIMDEEEKMIVSGIQRINEKLGTNYKIPARPFPSITMANAKEKLTKIGIIGEKKYDFSPEEEKAISKIIEDETGSEFVFVTDYHITIRPFYHMRHEDNPELTKSFDLLYKGLEITTGAQREHRYDVLLKQIEEKGMKLEGGIADYVQFFKYGCPPHGGAGIGPGRIIMQMLDLGNIREVTYLPRDVKRLKP